MFKALSLLLGQLILSYKSHSPSHTLVFPFSKQVSTKWVNFKEDKMLMVFITNFCQTVFLRLFVAQKIFFMTATEIHPSPDILIFFYLVSLLSWNFGRRNEKTASQLLPYLWAAHLDHLAHVNDTCCFSILLTDSRGNGLHGTLRQAAARNKLEAPQQGTTRQMFPEIHDVTLVTTTFLFSNFRTARTYCGYLWWKVSCWHPTIIPDY